MMGLLDRLSRPNAYGRWLLLFVLAVFMLSACSSVGSVAARRGDQGIQLLIGTCPEERVQNLELSHYMGGSDWQVLWRIERDSPTKQLSQVTVGQAPEGFRTVVPLETDLDPSELYTVWADAPSSNYEGSFTPEELSVDEWQHGSAAFEDDAAFLREADDYCGTEYLELDDQIGRLLWILVPLVLVAGVIWLVAKAIVMLGKSATKSVRRDS